MTSILKVDTIQNAAGGTPTAADLGLNVTGGVLQVVQGTKTGAEFTTTSTSYTAVGLSASITPTSATSKILVMVSAATASANSGSYWGTWALYRDGTNRLSGAITGATVANTVAGTQGALVYLDSPSTTSSVTYAIYGKSEGNSSTFYFNKGYGVVDDETATITLIEIAG